MVRALETICIVVLGLTACYQPPQPDCGFYCGAGGACPEDYTCTSDNRCRRIGAADPCEPDAGVPPNESMAPMFPDADVTPPMLTFMRPMDLETNVSRSETILVRFSEQVFNVSSLTMSAFSNGSVVMGQLSAIGVPPDYSTYELVPTDLLPANMTVTVTLTSQIYDAVGHALVTPMAGQLTFSFTTGS